MDNRDISNDILWSLGLIENSDVTPAEKRNAYMEVHRTIKYKPGNYFSVITELYKIAQSPQLGRHDVRRILKKACDATVEEYETRGPDYNKIPYYVGLFSPLAERAGLPWPKIVRANKNMSKC